MLKGLSWTRLTGLTIHILLGGLLVLVGLAMFNHDPSHFDLDRLQSSLICGGAALAGILLIVPRTALLGALLASAFFGWTLCFHMVRHESYVAPSAFLLVTWVSGCLRNPDLFLNSKS
ncbi:MAG TPA: hypothetical protein VE988_07145 [Gemmataceae bacterium]|nr:hypothetical protein [Gemmataceae bacterium]